MSDIGAGGLGAAGSFAIEAGRFGLELPEGCYRIAIELGRADRACSTTLWSQSRRLMLEVRSGPGERPRRSIAVEVRRPGLECPPPRAPGGRRVLMDAGEAASPDWAGRLELRLGGDLPERASIEIARAPELPRLFLAGDSTVADQWEGPYASWGQMLPRFMASGIAVANHAHSGETLKSFASSLRLAKILEGMRAGDYLLIQFGHNDQKREWLQTYAEARTVFAAHLRAFIAEARARGATPILGTPPQRRRFGPGGRIENSHGDYPDAIRDLAASEGIALVDLEAASRSLYEALGPEGSRSAFAAAGDETHHGAYGAYELAKYVASALRASDLPLAAFVSPELGDYDPAKPGDRASAPRLDSRL